MKKILIILFSTGFNQVVLSQDFESIVVAVEHADEPPTKHGPVVFEITFTSDEQNNFVAKTYTRKYKGKKRVKLEEPYLINSNTIQRFMDWKAMSKSQFSLNEFDINIDELNNSNTGYKPNFEITEEIIKTDSFNICKDWQFKRSYSTGGYSIKIKLTKNNKSTEFLNFSSNDIGSYKFDLNPYLLIQPVLEDRIPKEFRIDSFFDKESLITRLNYYFNVIECEGFYYNEFINQNPQRTKQENRMMIGWNFEEYLKKRNKK